MKINHCIENIYLIDLCWFSVHINLQCGGGKVSRHNSCGRLRVLTRRRDGKRIKSSLNCGDLETRFREKEPRADYEKPTALDSEQVLIRLSQNYARVRLCKSSD